jgi:hypothetical protein
MHNSKRKRKGQEIATAGMMFEEGASTVLPVSTGQLLSSPIMSLQAVRELAK